MPDVGPVVLEKSGRARRLILSVRLERVRVAIPNRLTFKKAEQFARANLEWILRQRATITQREARDQHLKAGLSPIDRKAARAHLVTRLDELATYHGLPYNRVSIRGQRSRWGSCSATNNISLNMKLLWLPTELQDYVLLHELVHTLHPDHSSRFWERLEQICPGARRSRRQLREYRYCLTAQ